jgi:multidrug efflux pump subunit AcrB
MSRASTVMAFGACLAMMASACSPAPAATVVLPEVERVAVLVSASYPGRTAEEVESLLAEPLGQRLQGLAGLHETNLTAMQDTCAMILTFGNEIDQTTALDAVHQALADASYLPADLPHQPQISAYHSPERKDGQFPRLGALIQPTQKAKPTR